MDILNAIADLLDQNIRVVRYGAPLIATVGIFMILKKTHAFSLFKSVHDIPNHLIKSNATLRGITKKVHNGQEIEIQHVPIFFRNLKKRESYFGEVASTFKVAFVGVQPCDGCTEYVKEVTLDKRLKIIPLGINQDDALEAVVYIKKGMLSRSVCINEQLVEQGLAVVAHNTELTQSQAYLRVTKRLLAAEVRADKKGKGRWKRPSLIERLRAWLNTKDFLLQFRRKSS